MSMKSFEDRLPWARPWAVMLVCVPGSVLAQSDDAAVCQEASQSVTEDFGDEDFKDEEATSAEGWPGPLTLARKGNTFETSGESFGVRVFVVGDGDFDGDGYNDMVAQLLSPTCHLHFLRNVRSSTGEFVTFSAGGDPGDPLFESYRVYDPDVCDSNAPAVITGDYDGDGDKDFVYLNGKDQNTSGRLAAALYFENRLIPDGVGAEPFNFAEPVDVLPQFNSGEFEPAFHWTTKYNDVVDWNGDGFDDILLSSSYGTGGDGTRVLLFRSNGDGSFQSAFTLLRGTGLTPPFADTGARASGGCGGVSRGITALAARDFDGDGAFDLVIGSVSEPNLKHWRNDGTDTFTPLPDIGFPEAGITFAIGADFDGDGDQDLVVGRDGWNCGGTNGDVFYFDNDGEGNFSRRTNAIIDGGVDLDVGIAFDIDGDEQGTPDLIAADGNDSGTYSQILSAKGSIYNLEGVAQSLTYETPEETQAFTKVRVTVNDSTPAGTGWDFYVSNNNGQSWEQVPAELLDGDSDDFFTFTNFGSDLKWRIDLHADEDELPSDEAVFAPAAKSTPTINSVQLEYFYVDRRLYSRSGLALASELEVSPDVTADVLYSSAFFYPGYEGFLIARDITGFEGEAGDSDFTAVNEDPDVVDLWEAGANLAARGESGRVIYTARAIDGDGEVNDRLPFVLDNSEVLADEMSLNVDEADRIITYVRAGMDHPDQWKLYDAGHSTPVFVGVPNEDPEYAAFSDNNYQSFIDAQENRPSRVYIASNAGMVHSFDAATGEEVWAFIPNNLLGRLKAQLGVDADGEEEYVHQFLVDGQLVVRDVYDGSNWRTVLIAGQALGQGRGDNNFYFALDITDPDDPLALWEFTDPWDNTIEECTGTNPIKVTEETCTTICNDSCTGKDHVFEEVTPGEIYLEAESYNSTSTIDMEHQWEIESACPGGATSGACVQARPAGGDDNCDSDINECGAQLVYSFATLTAGSYRVFVRGFADSPDDNSVIVRVDETSESVVSFPSSGGWGWFGDGEIHELAAGDHTLTVYMREDGARFDRFLVTLGGASGGASVGAPQQCFERCTDDCEREDVDVTLSDGDEWPECGVGDNERCCIGTELNVCHPVGEACPELGTAMGETWSRPVVGRARVDGSARFLAFFGSGYNNLPTAPDTIGRSLYAIDATTGELIKQWEFEDIVFGPNNPSTIDLTVPGSAELADIFDPDDENAGPDGFVDRLYVGDLEGRLWKVELDADGIRFGETVSDASWPACVLFDAGDPDPGDGSGRTWAPIITKPAIGFPEAATNFPHIYFGTGGDDRVPDRLEDETEVQQRFYAVRDDVDCGAPYDTDPLVTYEDLDIAELEWVVGDGLEVDKTTELDPEDSEGTIEDRYWSDPVVLDNTIVFFASLPGKIESVNPCENLDGESRFFAYAARDFFDDTSQVQVLAGQTIFADGNPFLTSSTKIRQAVVLRKDGRVDTVARKQVPPATIDATDVFVQEFASLDTGFPDVLSITTQEVVLASSSLRVLRWREIGLPQ